MVITCQARCIASSIIATTVCFEMARECEIAKRITIVNEWGRRKQFPQNEYTGGVENNSGSPHRVPWGVSKTNTRRVSKTIRLSSPWRCGTRTTVRRYPRSGSHGARALCACKHLTRLEVSISPGKFSQTNARGYPRLSYARVAHRSSE